MPPGPPRGRGHRVPESAVPHTAVRLRDARNIGARRQLLAFLHRHALHDARDAGAHLQRIRRQPALFQRPLELAQPRHARLQLRRNRGIEGSEALFLDLRALRKLGRQDLRARVLQLRHRVHAECALFGDRLQTRGFRGRARFRERGAPVQALALEFESRRRIFGARSRHFELRGIGRALDLGIGELDDDRVRLDGFAGADQHAVDARLDAG